MSEFTPRHFIEIPTYQIMISTLCTEEMVEDAKSIVKGMLNKLESIQIGDNQLVLTYKYNFER